MAAAGLAGIGLSCAAIAEVLEDSGWDSTEKRVSNYLHRMGLSVRAWRNASTPQAQAMIAGVMKRSRGKKRRRRSA